MTSTDKIEDGGCAFPNQPLGQDGMPWAEAEFGMTLRDWFAGQALAGSLTSAVGHASRAELAYAYADEMIKARGDRS